MKENNPHILGEAPIGKLLVEYSIPAIIGMTLTSLYNIIDSIFIGHGVGALAISGLAITFSADEPAGSLLYTGGRRRCYTFFHPTGDRRIKKGAEDILAT